MSNRNRNFKILAFATLFSSVALLSGCHNSDNTSSTNNNDQNKRTYTIIVSNLTANQPFSPVGLVLSKTGFQAWENGQSASVSLENMAEGGNVSMLISDASALSSTLGTSSGTGVIGPGGSEQFELSADDAADAKLTVVSMLVNTNDAFTGVNSAMLSSLNVGQTLALSLRAYDAGTEANTESSGTMPGPADGGVGFNMVRDDILNAVTIHQGVVTKDDGLSTSVLNQSHRFDSPVARVTITRTE